MAEQETQYVGRALETGAAHPVPGKGLKICINTQTPLMWFVRSPANDAIMQGKEVDISQLTEGTDYNYSSGGVTRMVFPLIKHMLDAGTLSEAHWVSLNQYGPETIKTGAITHHFVSLGRDKLESYGNVKETMWKAAHGAVTDITAAEDIFMSDDFPEYTYYNRLTAETIGRLDTEKDFDLFYIHDFQQLPIGHMLPTLKPKIYRWHTPFDASMIPDKWKEVFITYFNSYDLVIVSADRYLKSLRSFGYSRKVKKIYPYVDAEEYTHPSADEIDAVCKKVGVKQDDVVMLTVARMDPMKGQDRAIAAFASIANRHPKLKLVLVGNGSFSSSKQGLGLSKADRWRAKLDEQCKRLGLSGRVVFAGHLVQAELDAMYERSAFTILPSVKEGFGLVVIESWLHRKACMVTERAGAAELVTEGSNGLLFDPDDTVGMAEKMHMLLEDTELSSRIGAAGYETSKLCSIGKGLEEETKVIKELVGE